jgi:3D (Asp-Asp-Asp) domain-containing protein
LEKATVKNFGVFLKLINLTAVICILSSIVNTARTKGDDPITLLKTTITKVETGSGPVLNESGITAESEPYKPENTTNKQPNNSQSNAEQPGEWESIQMRITAYCPCPKCCGQYSDGITACGHEIQPGDTFVAADRRYPFGTEMLIPGYSNSQPVPVLDRGGAIKGNRLDVFFATHQEALEWGVKYLNVKVNHK